MPKSQDIQVLADVDEAERDGDAGAALALVRSSQKAGNGGWWAPGRVERLCLLAALEPLLPAWVTSRWILEQALQQLTDPRGPSNDGDWVRRQTSLYEHGALTGFLRDRASAGLLERADRVREWAQAPMGGYRLVSHGPAVTTWTDLASHEDVAVPTLGSGVLMLPGEHAIGRLVPIEGGTMFETAPLAVPDDVARRVAGRPSSWQDVLRGARAAGAEIKTGGHRFGLIVDVPDVALLVTVYAHLDWRGQPGAAELVGALMTTAKCALADLAGFARRDPGQVPSWPCLAAAMLDPIVLVAVTRAPEAADLAVLDRLGSLLAEPAAAVCRSLAGTVRAAAQEPGIARSVDRPTRSLLA